MRNEDYHEFAAIFLMACETMSLISAKRSNTTVPDGVIRIYFKVLKEYSIKQVRQAFSTAIGNMKSNQGFPGFPGPGDIREIIMGNGREPNLSSLADAAANKVFAAVENSPYGPYGNVAFDDPCIHHTLISMFGPNAWVKLCSMDADELKWRLFKDFKERYRCLAAKNSKQGVYTPPVETPRVLQGLLKSSEMTYTVPGEIGNDDNEPQQKQQIEYP